MAGRFNQVWTSIFLVAGSSPRDRVRVLVDRPSEGSVEEEDGCDVVRRDEDEGEDDDRNDRSWVI